ncbi:hypothetical protein ACT3SP_01445 [Brachybacterium sp. AOP43-C2-M15]|uniref:hypothetical protein n=1 Tax=Brachybacterium sp. AOP43-C2-M15 TaxID=3457661 RepID=UPI00403487D1
MPTLPIRPATSADAADPAFDDLLPDRWREGDNRRSVVATDAEGTVLGHCRGIDNVFHPDSRTLVLEVRDGAPWAAVADALLTAQISVSALPLHVKPSAHEPELARLCARHGGVLVQLMPPWRYVVDPALRSWSQDHRTTGDELSARRVDASRHEEMLDLYVEHYTAQHARWSPAAAAEQLRTENAPNFEPGGEGSADPERTTILVRAGRIAAQALAWPPEPDGGTEITVQSRPHDGPRAREDMEACLAAVIDRSADGDVLLIDSHVTEELESAMMRDLPGPPPHPADTWTAIVAIPVPSGPGPIPLPAERIPADAAPLVERLQY